MNTSVSLNSADSVWITTWVDPTTLELAFDITVKTSESTQVTTTFSHQELMRLVVEKGQRMGLARPKFENRTQKPRRAFTQNWDGRGPNTVVLPSKEDAEKVLSAMVEILDKFGFVALNDLYDLTGFKTNYGGSTIGWKNLSGSAVKETTDGHHGWFLDLPPMIELEAG